MTAVPLVYPLDILASYFYFGNETMAKIVKQGCWRVIGDSGAYSAWSLGKPIALAEYAEWCRTWWDALCWAASLDVIGDPVATFRNWTTLRDRHNLLTVPTVHAGTGTEWIDQYATEGATLIGLGGLAGRGMGVRGYRWAVHAVRYTRDRWPDVRLHLWGMAAAKYVERLPVWSADSSSTVTIAYRWARIRLFNPTTGRLEVIYLRGNEIYRHGPLLRQVYGIDPDIIARSSSVNRRVLARLMSASTQTYATWLQTRHNITPPTMFRDPRAADLVGPRLHVVDNDFTNLLPEAPR